MAVIGTFGSFTTARLGIYASQASLQVTGNNIANINTTGYTRQRADLYSLNSTGTSKYANPMGVDIGYGVLVKSTSQLRDPYLDIRYRNENTKLGATNATLEGLLKISQTLDEVNKGTTKNGVIEDALMNLKTQLSTFSVHMGSEEYNGLVREAAKSLTTFFNNAAKDIQADWELEKDKLVDTIKTVNECLVNIRNLNEQIRKQGLYGDLALELRDHRNLEIDKLSENLGINVEYSMERIDQYTEVEKLTITLKDVKDANGNPVKLVDGLYAGQLSFSTEEVNPDYKPGEKQEAMLNPAYVEGAAEGDPGYGKYLDENGKGTNDINKANRVLLNPEWSPNAKTDPTKTFLLNPKYDPSILTRDVTIDGNPVKVLANPDTTAGALPYLDADGNPTNDPASAARAQLEYVAADGSPYGTSDVNLAKRAPQKYLTGTVDANGNPETTNDPAQAAEASRKYMTDPKLVAQGADPTTNDPDMAAKVDPNKFLLQVERLEDKNGRVMDKGKDTESITISLNDTGLTGAIQSMRELLTEEGEFASKSDAGIIDDAAIESYLKNLKDADGNPVYSDADVTAIMGNAAAKAQAQKSLERASDKDANIKMGIPYYQKRLDLLAQKFAETLNEANQLPASMVYESKMAGTAQAGTDLFVNGKDGSTDFVDKNGNKIQIKLDDVTTVVQEQSRNAAGELEFNPDGTPKMKDVLDEYGDPVRVPKNTPEAAELLELLRSDGQLTKEYSYYKGGVLFSNNGNNNDPTNITAANITVSNSWAANTVRVLNSTKANYPVDPTKPEEDWVDHSSANDNINHILSLIEKKLDYSASEIEPDAVKGSQTFYQGSFLEMYTNLGATLGSQTYTVYNIAYNYEVTTLDIDNNRLSVSGVDLNDEATNMMQFQKSYQAACRLMTTIDSMLDTLINGTLR
ncbi:MAG: hypothetical protein HFF69_00245 [Oscillospiraceae bacterium]|jgi:flagellar hook-associated protein FlgK|nr:hypothetical protein [Oscillospiraceae bacterium]